MQLSSVVEATDISPYGDSRAMDDSYVAAVNYAGVLRVADRRFDDQTILQVVQRDMPSKATEIALQVV